MGILDGLGDLTGMGGGGGILGGLKLYNLPIVGGMFDNPNELAKQQAFRDNARMIADYRPELQQGRINAMNSTMGAYQGLSNWMGQVAPGVWQQPGPAVNPMSPRSQAIGTQNPSTTESTGSWLGRSVGNAGGGALAGAGAGAMIGSLGGPGGTAAGAMLGGAIGGGAGLLSGLSGGPRTQGGGLANYGTFQPYDSNARRA